MSTTKSQCREYSSPHWLPFFPHRALSSGRFPPVAVQRARYVLFYAPEGMKAGACRHSGTISQNFITMCHVLDNEGSNGLKELDTHYLTSVLLVLVRSAKGWASRSTKEAWSTKALAERVRAFVLHRAAC